MRTFITLLLAAFTFSVNAQPFRVGDPTFGHKRAVEEGGGPTYLVSEDFEGTGYDGGLTDSAGNPDEDYATSPAPLAGGQSIFIDGTAATQTAITADFGEQTTLNVYFLMHVTTMPAGTGREILRFLLNGSQSAASELTINSAGQLTITLGTTAVSTTTTVSADTTYHVWVELQAESVDTALDGVGRVMFAPVSGDGIKPTSDGGGKGWAQRTTMNGELPIDQIWVTSQFSTTGVAWIGDKLRVDDVEIGSNPP